MLAKAVAEVLKKHPIVNAAYVEGGIKYNKGEELNATNRVTLHILSNKQLLCEILNKCFLLLVFADVNVAMAVAIDGGLITPTIIKANEKDLFSISRNWKELVDKAKNKKLTPAEYNSGTYMFFPSN